MLYSNISDFFKQLFWTENKDNSGLIYLEIDSLIHKLIINSASVKCLSNINTIDAPVHNK